MNSHPNYVGYNALKGKPSASVKRIVTTPSSKGPLKLSDFNTALDPGWLGALNEVRKWCAENGVKFAVSRHDYQLATVNTSYCQIVLWAASEKRSKKRFIKPRFQGSIGHETKAQALLAAICGLLP